MDQQEAIIDLQTRTSHQDAALQELTKVVLAQEDQIIRLKAAVIAMKQQMEDDVFASSIQAGGEPPPPHY